MNCFLAFFLWGLILTPLEAQWKTFKIHCTVDGLSVESKIIPIVDGTLEVSEKDFSEKEVDPFVMDYHNQEMEAFLNSLEELTEQERQDYISRFYIPMAIKSDFFGQKGGGIQLQISAWKPVGVKRGPEFFQTVTLNGVTIKALIDNGFSRISFNDDLPITPLIFNTDREALQPDGGKWGPTISTSEGDFRYITSICRGEILRGDDENIQ